MNAQTVKMAKVASPSRANKNNNSKKNCVEKKQTLKTILFYPEENVWKWCYYFFRHCMSSFQPTLIIFFYH